MGNHAAHVNGESHIRPFRMRFAARRLESVEPGVHANPASASVSGMTIPATAPTRLPSCRRPPRFISIARSHGLGSESDDPYALRHIYATLRIAAHHPTLYIESSMGTGLVGKVYGGVIRRYQGKGPLDIDAELQAARNAALATRRR
jgi:hypothetical protein